MSKPSATQDKVHLVLLRNAGFDWNPPCSHPVSLFPGSFSGPTRLARSAGDGRYSKGSRFVTHSPKAKEEKLAGPNWFIFGLPSCERKEKNRCNVTVGRLCYRFPLVGLRHRPREERERRVLWPMPLYPLLFLF